MGSFWRENGLVFASETGEPLDRRIVTNHRFKPLLKRTGLPQIRFHDLRYNVRNPAIVEKREAQDRHRNVGPRYYSVLR